MDTFGALMLFTWTTSEPFLPLGGKGGSTAARRRTSALSKLFDKDRVDAWQTWVLLITVEAKLYNSSARETLRNYLQETGEDASIETFQALEFLLSPAPTPVEQTMRLVHGATAILVADSAKTKDVMVTPRGTLLYTGANGRPMVHMAFEFCPNPKVLSGISDRLRLLSAPILRPKSPSREPWVELLPDQCPGVTRVNAGQNLDFLEPHVVHEVLKNLS